MAEYAEMLGQSIVNGKLGESDGRLSDFSKKLTDLQHDNFEQVEDLMEELESRYIAGK